MTSVFRGSDNFDTANVFGAGQTVQLLTGSRAINTTYTNSTGEAIVVNTVCFNDTAGGGSVLLVDGAARWYGSSAITTNNRTAVQGAIVPAGSTYRLETAYAGVISGLQFWTEYRA